MNIRRTAPVLIAALAAVSLLGKAATAQSSFLLSTTVGPNAGSQGPNYSVSNGQGGNLVFTGEASGLGTATTDVTLATITENDLPGNPAGTVTNAPFTIVVTLTPQAPPVPGQNGPVSGTISGTFSFSGTTTSATFTSAPLVFDFGSRGAFTVDTFNFVRPGPQSQNGSGAIAATVRFAAAPSPAPEPAGWMTVPSLSVLFGMTVLQARRRKARSF